MPLFWLSLAIALVLTIASLAFATLRGLETFRALKALGAGVGTGLDHVTATTAQIERHLELAATSGTQLEASLARLRRSKAQLNVLTAAIADVQAALGRVTGVVPKK